MVSGSEGVQLDRYCQRTVRPFSYNATVGGVERRFRQRMILRADGCQRTLHHRHPFTREPCSQSDRRQRGREALLCRRSKTPQPCRRLNYRCRPESQPTNRTHRGIFYGVRARQNSAGPTCTTTPRSPVALRRTGSPGLNTRSPSQTKLTHSFIWV